MKSTLIIIPAFNEGQAIANVVVGVKRVVPQADILVVDDGSEDSTSQQAINAKALVVRHVLNRGLGGAIGTGLSYAQAHRYQYAVTLDADGQHDPNDILKILQPLIQDQADVVVGSRLKSNIENMPWDRRLINTFANLITYLMFGVSTTDSQSGFRGFNQTAIQRIQLKTERMEVSSELFAEIHRHHLRYTEVPIKVIYTSYSLQKGQSNSNMLSVALKLMLRLFR